MKRLIIIILLFPLAISLSACKKDDVTDTTSNEHSVIIGTWKRSVHWGSIDGTETITFTNNSTYSVELERIEEFNGGCDFDPYCNNDYSGEYWFEGKKLYYNEPTLEWTDYWDTWSVQGNLLHLDNAIYNKQ